MKIVKRVLIIFLVVLAVVGLWGFSQSEPLPKGTPSAQADSLAVKMMQAVNVGAWNQTNWVSWSFYGRNEYVWDKASHWVEFTSGTLKVLFNTKTLQGQGYKKGTSLSGGANDKAVQKAWKNFCNDSYWLNPVVKAFDEGTTRSLVTTKDGQEGLMVTYASGGVTPGDSYVWLLDESFRPIAWKMWVKIIPIGGVKNAWSNWEQLSTGAWISTHHTFFNQETHTIRDAKGGKSFQEIGFTADPFVSMR